LRNDLISGAPSSLAVESHRLSVITPFVWIVETETVARLEYQFSQGRKEGNHRQRVSRDFPWATRADTVWRRTASIDRFANKLNMLDAQREFTVHNANASLII